MNEYHKNTYGKPPYEQKNKDRIPVIEPNVPIFNAGWFYYKYYYKDLGNPDYNLKALNESLLHVNPPESISYQPDAIPAFSLKTTYPGLIIGTGVAHEAGDKTGVEYKLGLSFDYTTGLPVIPGSSLKGLLRSVFPGSVKKKAKQTEEELIEKTYRTPRKQYIKQLLKELGEENINIEQLEEEIFEGIKDRKPIPVYEHDVFFDAFPATTDDQSVSFLFGADYTTPHTEALKNPIPVCFMKILPEVRINFYFMLHTGILSAGKKEKLFKRILLDIGIGAKTNVGYGQLVEVPEEK